MELEVDLFSGQPNPSWRLDAAEQQELWQRLGLLQPGRELGGLPGLGYRGLLLVEGGQERLRIYQEQVTLHTPGAAPQHFNDPGRTLERYLLHKAQAHLDPKLYRYLAQVLGP